MFDAAIKKWSLVGIFAQALLWFWSCSVVIIVCAGIWVISPEILVIKPTEDANLELDPDQLQNNLGDSSTSATGEITDGRAEIVSKFLKRYNSPLQPYDHYGQVFVDIADKYGFDFRLLPAIAMQESNLCKAIPEDTFNCLGFGIHKRGTLAFPSFEANFERAGKELKANYINKGLTTPEQIMRKYTPSSDGSWANSVNQWMAEMRYDDRESGRTRKIDANVMEFAKPTLQN